MSDQSMRDAVLKHYQRFFGTPAGSEVLQDSRRTTPEFEILEWDLTEDRDVWMYASLGRSLPAWDSGRHRVELIHPSKERSMDVAVRILGAAMTAPAEGAGLASGHTIALSEPAFPGSPMQRLLLSKPWGEEEEFEILDLPRGIHVEFLMVIPIHESEFRYLRQHGEALLWERFADQEIDFADGRREAAAL
jgi:hypothetical protein